MASLMTEEELKKRLEVPEEPLPERDSSATVKEYLINKYPDRFKQLQSERDSVASKFDSEHGAPGVGGNLLMGLVAALQDDKSFADVAKETRDMRNAARESALKPYDEKIKSAKEAQAEEEGAFDFGRKQTRAAREDTEFSRNEDVLAQGKDPTSSRSASARQTVTTFAPKMAPLVEGKSAEEIERIMPWIKTKMDQDFRASEAEKNRDLKKQLLTEKTKKDSQKPNKAVEAKDKDYAKHYNEFTEGGAVNARSSIENLEKLAAEMEKDPTGGGGRFAQKAPDWLRSRTAIKNRDNARNFANVTLKKLFGGQLSDAEREAAAREYYNDALDNKENAALIKKKVEQLRGAYENEVEKAKYFEKNDTLSGWESGGLEKPKSQITEADIDNMTEEELRENGLL